MARGEDADSFYSLILSLADLEHFFHVHIDMRCVENVRRSYQASC